MITKFTPCELERAVSPESVGISSKDIADFLARLEREGLGNQGYMLYRHGKLAASSISSPYRPSDKRHVYSVSKSWTSTAIGLAVDEGLLTVDDKVIDFFPEDLPEVISENLAKMTVKHLLSMNTGHQNDTAGRVGLCEPGWAKRFLSLEVEHEPGTHFCYNSTATYMLSAIITKLTGMRMVDYLMPRLFNPLGIRDIWWEESADGVCDGGWGIHVSPEDMLKLGILYLNKGIWNGRRILSEAYIADASSAVSDNSSGGTPDWRLGYGYQWWRCQHNCFRADGAYGQYIIVSPETDSVAVIISETGDMQAILNAYYDTILDGMKDEPIRESEAAYDLSARPFAICPTFNGGHVERCEYHVSDSFTGLTKLSLESVGERLLARFYGKGGAIEVIFGAGEWEYNRVRFCPISPTTLFGNLAFAIPAEIAASWALEDGKILLRMQFVSTPHGMDFLVDLDSGKLTILRTIDRKANPIVLNLGCLY